MSVSSTKKPNSIRVTVAAAAGKCPQGFKVGDTWLIADGKTPAGMCAAAYVSIYGYIRVYRFGGTYPWDKKPGVIQVACPDATQRLEYEVRIVDND